MAARKKRAQAAKKPLVGAAAKTVKPRGRPATVQKQPAAKPARKSEMGQELLDIAGAIKSRLRPQNSSIRPPALKKSENKIPVAPKSTRKSNVQAVVVSASSDKISTPSTSRKRASDGKDSLVLCDISY